ncbi:MAG: hypothetical protein INF91_02130 [Alphaproteobacteria bacterium]|nr:hypothetical protein [Alphaproteobacteria bacterium]
MTIRSIAIRASLAAFAGLSTVALAAAPANAEPRPVTAPAAQTEDAAGGASADVAKAKKFCVMQTITGSRMPKKTCRTAEEWKAEGVDVSKRN